jgi:TetR/AcrR family transcriptional regulator, regulator of cefoperazone and chloramphenicol sensitivity
MRSETRATSIRFRPRRRPVRPDTRRLVLETACEVFAEVGFDAATGVEISQRAGVNTAAINYHFGGMDGLYEAVLEAASERLPQLAALSAAAAANTDARGRLRAIMELAIGAMLGPASQSWVLRIMGREAIAPSEAFRRLLLVPEGLPKYRFLRATVGEIMGLPEDHPAVARGCISVIAPLQIILIADRGILMSAFPDLGLGPPGAPELVSHMVEFALGGLAAVAMAEKTRKRERLSAEFVE